MTACCARSLMAARSVGNPVLRFRTCYGIHFTSPGAGGSAVPDIKAAMPAGELFRANLSSSPAPSATLSIG